MTSSSKQKSLRVLCFGDSLTSGWVNPITTHPYSMRLKRRLEQAYPDTKVEVITNGEPGDLASFVRFAKRLEEECDKRWFDWVILLGGTNDLAYALSADQIFAALEKVWDIPLSRNSKVLALTVPECRVATSPNKAELNEKILSHEEHNFHAFNLLTKIPYHSLSDEDREKYWSDGLHLTGDGYNWMGDHIADGLIECINE